MDEIKIPITGRETLEQLMFIEKVNKFDLVSVEPINTIDFIKLFPTIIVDKVFYVIFNIEYFGIEADEIILNELLQYAIDDLNSFVSLTEAIQYFNANNQHFTYKNVTLKNVILNSFKSGDYTLLNSFCGYKIQVK